MTRHAATIVALIACLGGAAAGTAAEPTPPQLIADAARKVVKVYGAGGTAGLEPYQTGILISPDGRILTAASTVLDGDAIDCVLDDGRRFAARLVGVDPRREVAVIDVEASDLPCFALAEAAPLVPPGTRVVALSNMFGVAAGDEPVTAQRGVVAAIVPLDARRGAADAPFRGLVYVLDRTTNNPGSPGGAVVDSRGRLLGMLGKELRSTAAGIWLNYALPAEELKRGLDEIVAGGAGDAADVGGEAFDTRKLGLVLVPDLLDRTPPFVESVDADSPAARAGLAADDLVIAVGSRSVTTRTAVEMAIGGLADGDAVKLTVIRRGGLVEIDLGPRPGGDQR